MKLSVVIATYNRRSLLEQTLKSLMKQDLGFDAFEVIVVVDGSIDGTIEYLKMLRHPFALQITIQDNQKQALARNAGIAAARSRVVLFLDDDIVCSRSLLRVHAEAHQLYPGSVVWGPLAVSGASRGGAATAWARLAARRAPDPNKVSWPQAAIIDANTSVPFECLRSCRGFDPIFGGARENVDLGVRLWKMGVRFRYEPRAIAEHVYVKSSRDLVEHDALEYGRNEVTLCRKHPEIRRYSNLSRVSRGSKAKVFLRKTIARLPKPLERLGCCATELAERAGELSAGEGIAIRLLKAQMGAAFYRGAIVGGGGWECLEREFGVKLPILLYHHVGPGQRGTYPELTISPERFEKQIQMMAEQGYTGILPSQWLAWCETAKPLPRKPVLITFDDAYRDIADYALPIIRRYRFGAAVYVVTRQIGGTNEWDARHGSGVHQLMTAEQIRAWAKEGIEFGSHTRTHRDLTGASPAQLSDEILGSREDLKTLLGLTPISFAYPYGRYDDAVVEHVKAAFKLGFTCNSGMNYLSDDPLLSRRTQVRPRDSLFEVGCRLRFGWNPVEHAKAKVRLRSRIRWGVSRLPGIAMISETWS